MTAKHTFNIEAFALFVRMRAEHPKHLSTTEAAAEAGVSRAQFFRAVHKQAVSVEASLNLCLWMNANPYSFLLDAETGRGLMPLPDAPVPCVSTTETRGSPQVAEAA